MMGVEPWDEFKGVGVDVVDGVVVATTGSEEALLAEAAVFSIAGGVERFGVELGGVESGVVVVDTTGGVLVS